MASSEKDRLESMIAVSLERAGQDSTAITQAQMRQYVQANKLREYSDTEQNSAIIRGAIVCNVTVPDVDYLSNILNNARNFKTSYESKYGTDALVYISKTLLWGCKKDGFPKWREFSTLCGINSVFGLHNAKKPTLLRHSMIVARQLGYKTPEIMKSELATRKDQVPMTRQQTRDVLDSLEAGESPLIQRCLASRTSMFFSTGNTHEELTTQVKSIIAARNKVKSIRAHDREVFNVKA